MFLNCGLCIDWRWYNEQGNQIVVLLKETKTEKRGKTINGKAGVERRLS